MKHCEDCKHFSTQREDDEDKSCCKRFPPTRIGEYITCFPYVHRWSGICGEFKPK